MTRRGRQRNRGGAEMDPARYSPITSQNRRRSFAYAVAGCAYMLRYQKNARVMLAATLIVMAFAFWLGVEAGHWAILILAVGLVWLAEFINAAIEAAVNLTASEFHPMAKAAKDVAAAAVLIAVFAAVMIGLLILGPPLVNSLAASAISS